MGEVINMRKWQNDKKQREIEASANKIKQSIERVKEIMRDANSYRRNQPSNQVSGQRGFHRDSDKPDFVFDSEGDKT